MSDRYLENAKREIAKADARIAELEELLRMAAIELNGYKDALAQVEQPLT